MLALLGMTISIAIAFAAKNARALVVFADPEGAAQDVRRFSKGQDVPWKNLLEATVIESAVSGKRLSFGYLFFGAVKEK